MKRLLVMLALALVVLSLGGVALAEHGGQDPTLTRMASSTKIR